MVESNIDPSLLPATPPGRNLFTALPGELRNRIYRYALTFEEHLEYSNGEFRPKFLPRFGFLEIGSHGYWFVEANQLKYVSRQIRQETLRLELEYNHISFIDYSKIQGVSSVYDFEQFIQSCSPTILASLTNIKICTGPRTCMDFIDDHFSTPSRSIIQDFALNYPDVNVIVQITSGMFASSTPTLLIHCYYFMRHALRGRPPARLFNASLEKAWETRRQQILPIVQDIPRCPMPNVRLRLIENWSENLESKLSIGPEWQNRTPEQKRELLLLGRMMHEEGI